MWSRLKDYARKIGRIEKVFLLLLLAYLPFQYFFPESAYGILLSFALFVVAAAAGVRFASRGIRQAIWRLRNRLLVAYLFIAVVPVALILLLVAVGAWILAGQISTYLVTTALEQRAGMLAGSARRLAAMPPPNQADRIRWMGPYFQQAPGTMVLVRSGGEWRFPEEAPIEPPPAGWKDAGGLVLKDGVIYLWGHAIRRGIEATLMTPVTPEMLADLVPNLGDVSIQAEALGQGRTGDGGATAKVSNSGKSYRLDSGQKERLPQAANWFDAAVTYLAPVPVAIWEEPNRIGSRPLFIRTRYSAVLRTVFGQTVEWGEGVTMGYFAAVIFFSISAAFLVVELISLVAGISLTHTITRAIHGLYEGTQSVMQGDFSHRIAVKGSDQLAQLSISFNTMIENLQRLVEIAKEKERLQSEIEIAREVQNQLFPKNVPESTTLLLKAVCKPARLVSGDYYDYASLPGSKLALGIGDVSGKGISAALLMATLQSTMRTQLRAGRELAAAADASGSTHFSLSTSALVSRLNQQLYTYTPPEKFATFFFGLYDEPSGLLTYTNAGHVQPVLIRSNTPTRLDVNGMVVGAFPFARYEESSVQLKSGDLLVCFTDGITEPENAYGEMFGEDRLVDVLLKHSNSDMEEIVASVLESVGQWTGSPELQDDMTILVARRI